MSKPDFTDIIGQQFEMLTVDEFVGVKKGKARYMCSCQCGNTKEVNRYSLLNGETKSCGCMRLIDTDDIIGRKFGKLTVITYEEGAGRRWEHYYRCRCECGKDSLVKRSHLLDGLITTCGDCTHIEVEGDHMRYYCHNGGSFIFDNFDLPLVEGKRFYVNPQGYAMYKNGDEDTKLTELLMNPGDGQLVDHIDGNKSNNRRSNLRFAECCENAWNAALKSSNSSGYKGVYFHKASGKYHVSIRVNGQRIFIGYFDNPEDGARAYDEAARFFHGEFACVNFPLPGEQGCRRNEEREELSA